MRSTSLFTVILLCAITLGLAACSDKSTGDKARIEVRLTDDPADYEAVNIDIQDVQVITSGNNDDWESLPAVQRGVYNLLELVNDQNALLVAGDVPIGHLHQIRLVLGPNNSIVVNGIEKPLETPSAEQSGLKLNVQQDIAEGMVYIIMLDFDARKSILETGNGKYILKPVIQMTLSAI